MTNLIDSKLLTKEQLRVALGFSSTRTIDGLKKAGKIPYLRLGHRIVRFELAAVLKALNKFEVREVGRK